MPLNFQFSRRPSIKHLLHFTRQLSILISAGTPLVKSLMTIYEQMPEGYFRAVVGKIIRNIEEGSSLSASLSKYPEIFSSLFINMVEAGEKGGLLPAVLKRIDHFLNHSYRLRQRIRMAIIYPAFVLIVAVLILTILTAFVVPSFTKIFDELGGKLPFATQILIKVSALFNHFWYIIPVIFILFVVLYSISIKNIVVKRFLDGVKLRLPVIGQLILQIEIARFSRLLGTLLMSGVPILDSLKITRNTSSNFLFSSAIGDIQEKIEKGSDIYSSMQEHNVFPKILSRMVNVGEESGQLDKILLQVADEYEEEAEGTIMSLTSLLEPLLIVVMGIIVGFIVIALFFPIFTLGGLVK